MVLGHVAVVVSQETRYLRASPTVCHDISPPNTAVDDANARRRGATLSTDFSRTLNRIS